MDAQQLTTYNLSAGPNGNQVSYAYFVAFISLLNNTELIKRVYLNSTQGSRTEAVTKVID